MCTKVKMVQEPLLIAGLGNPGKEYKDTRHNIGFMVADRLSNQLDIPLRKLKFKSIIGTGKFYDHQLIIAKPQTYMNASGKSIIPLMNYFNVTPENLLVIHDDLDIPLGSIRIRPSGGTSGQKGMKSIVENMGSDKFPRLRIGIGRPPGRMNPADYVLHNFDNDQIPLINESLDRAVKAIILFIEEGILKAMNTYNGDLEVK